MALDEAEELANRGRLGLSRSIPVSPRSGIARGVETGRPPLACADTKPKGGMVQLRVTLLAAEQRVPVSCNLLQRKELRGVSALRGDHLRVTLVAAKMIPAMSGL
jgi:hypothetical protein